MYQIDNATVAASQPAPTTAGTPGFFTDGNPATGVPATIVPAEWLNSVMMELSNFVTGAGITLDKSKFNQVQQALQKYVQAGGMLVANDVATVANTYVVNYVPGLTALTDGMVLWFKAKSSNTGAATLSINSLGVQPLVGGSHSPLQGGEVIANGKCQVVWNATIGAFVLIECTGAAIQVASATASQHAAQFGQVIAAAGQQGRLFYTSGNLAFVPFRGNKIFIPGIGVQTIPVGGIVLAPSGLTANTLYYIYVSLNSGSLGFDISTTPHATDAATGIEVKSGDNTRLFVGMEYALGPTTFAGLCRSWFNDPGFVATTPLTSNTSTTSTTPAELSSSMRTPFLLFSGEIPVLSASGGVSVSTANFGTATVIGVDGTTVVDPSSNATPSSTSSYPFALSAPRSGLSEGYHYATLLGYVGGAVTGTWSGSATAGTRSSLSVFIPPRK